MGCFLPFSSNNLEISFFVFRPTVVLVDDLLEALKIFSHSTGSLGCVQSSILKSIHGNLIIWYGAWTKKSTQDKELLFETLLPMLTNLSTMAILDDHSFFDAYAGESKDGTSSAAKFSTGDTISICATIANAGDIKDLSYSYLAVFKSCFQKIDGVASGVCLKCQSKNRVVSLYVWKSLHFCYSWILNSGYRKSMLPYLDWFSPATKYDVFWVVYVNGDNVLNFRFLGYEKRMENEGESKEERIVQM